MSEIGLFVTSTCNFNIVVHMEACTRATLTVLTQEQTVVQVSRLKLCAGFKADLRTMLRLTLRIHMRDMCREPSLAPHCY